MFINPGKKSISLKYQFILIFFFSYQAEVWSHHAGEGQSMAASTRFIDPFTGKKEKPSDYLLITQDFQKGTIDNSNLHTTTLFAETNFANGRFAMNASLPWTYYEQKDRADAARYGKAYLGAKWNPLIDKNGPFFLVLEGRLGFPSGGDTDRFAGGDYYSGIANLTLGTSFGKWLFVLRGSGIFPLSKDHSTQDAQSGLPFWAKDPQANPEMTNGPIKIQKVSQWFGYVTYFLGADLSVFAGYLYRTPYVNIIGGGSVLEEDASARKKFPKAFQEASLGFNWAMSKGNYLTVSGRLPLARDPEIRLYDYAITTSVSIAIPEWKTSSKKETEDTKSDKDLEE